MCPAFTGDSSYSVSDWLVIYGWWTGLRGHSEIHPPLSSFLSLIFTLSYFHCLLSLPLRFSISLSFSHPFPPSSSGFTLPPTLQVLNSYNPTSLISTHTVSLHSHGLRTSKVSQNNSRTGSGSANLTLSFSDVIFPKYTLSWTWNVYVCRFGPQHLKH